MLFALQTVVKVSYKTPSISIAFVFKFILQEVFHLEMEKWGNKSKQVPYISINIVLSLLLPVI